MTTEVLGPRHREVQPATPGPLGSEFDWLFHSNNTAFLVTHPSRRIDTSNMPDNYRIIYLGRLNEILSSTSPRDINFSRIRISFIFNEDRVEVAKRVYGESIGEFIRDPVQNMAREWQEFKSSGYIFLPTSIPNTTEDPNSAGITGKFVAFRIKSDPPQSQPSPQ